MPLSRSPSPKRRRLSSPTYDNQYTLSQEELHAFDTFDQEFSMSQKAVSPPRPSQALSTSLRRKRSQAIAFALGEVEEDTGCDQGDSREGSPPAAFKPPARGLFDKPVPNVHANPSENTHKVLHSTRPSGFSSAASLAHLSRPAGEASRFSGVVTPKCAGFGFASALVAVDSRQAPPENTPSGSLEDEKTEQDYSDWFKPIAIPAGALAFQSAKALSRMDNAAASGTPRLESMMDVEEDFEAENIPPELAMAPPSALPGFTTGLKFVKPQAAGINDWANPSAEALARAEQKMKEWQRDIDEAGINLAALEPVDDILPEASTSSLLLPLETPTRPRPALRAVENSMSSARAPDVLGSPSPAGRKLDGQMLGGQKSIQAKSKAFKSPLILRPGSRITTSSSHIGSPLNPNRLSTSASMAPAFTTPTRPSASTSAPVGFSPARATTSSSSVSDLKALGVTPRRAGLAPTPGKSKFKTPFKAGFRPGDPGRVQLEKLPSQRDPLAQGVVTILGEKKPAAQRKQLWGCFDLTPPEDRQTLASSGLMPQAYTSDELEEMNFDYAVLSQITVETARYYTFHAASVIPPTNISSRIDVLDPAAALSELHDRKCFLATEEWVTNHWCLILWKLAGMVALDPDRERDPRTRRWCWREVIRQFLYRYERELNSASRPALRLITTNDAPASCPMVLCVSNVTWVDAGEDEHGQPVQKPRLEVTDGWYRLRAEIDGPLERAVARGAIRVGRKIAVAGARLLSDSKDPREVLEAYEKVTLQLYGNSSHMAPWHAKLGFAQQPWIATLDSLTSDGGLVSLMDITVLRTHPIGFVQFLEEGGQTIQDGPWDEKEENRRQAQWEARRESEETKLRLEFEKKLNVLEGYAERLERRAGPSFNPSDWESPPEKVDDWFYQLENNENVALLLSGLRREDAGWLARHVRAQCMQSRERLRDEISGELDTVCPPREVRNFRVVVVKDAQWEKREPLRQAQVTIWDILGYTFSEGGKPGAIEVGQRFRVSSCMPSQKSAWMKVALDAEIYLTAWRGSRWLRVK